MLRLKDDPYLSYKSKIRCTEYPFSKILIEPPTMY